MQSSSWPCGQTEQTTCPFEQRVNTFSQQHSGTALGKVLVLSHHLVGEEGELGLKQVVMKGAKEDSGFCGEPMNLRTDRESAFVQVRTTLKESPAPGVREVCRANWPTVDLLLT